MCVTQKPKTKDIKSRNKNLKSPSLFEHKSCLKNLIFNAFSYRTYNITLLFGIMRECVRIKIFKMKTQPKENNTGATSE